MQTSRLHCMQSGCLKSLTPIELLDSFKRFRSTEHHLQKGQEVRLSRQWHKHMATVFRWRQFFSAPLGV